MTPRAMRRVKLRLDRSYAFSLDLSSINLTMSADMRTSVLVLLITMTLVTLLGWAFSWRAAKLKDEALTRLQVESKQAIAEANKATAIANQQTAAANLELAQLQSKMLPRKLTKEQ